MILHGPVTEIYSDMFPLAKIATPLQNVLRKSHGFPRVFANPVGLFPWAYSYWGGKNPGKPMGFFYPILMSFTRVFATPRGIFPWEQSPRGSNTC